MLELETRDRAADGHPTVIPLFRGRLAALGRFRCRLGDPLWRQENRIGDQSHLVFPSTPVRIALRGAPPILTDPTLAIWYRPGERFHREPRSPRGDDCVFAVVAPAVVDELRSALAEPFRHVPAATFLRLVTLTRDVSDGRADELEAEERLLEVVAGALGGDVARNPAAPATAHRLADEVKEVLVARLGERLTLEGLGREVAASPFHLARSFRRATGQSIHQYRLQLRLREALTRLDEPELLASLAVELGFASHSHLTDSFRRVFGTTPTALRARAHDS